jgi:hypothetical protein
MPDLTAEAHTILREACETAGLDPAGAELLRLRSNAVFKLRVPIIVRITRSASVTTRMPTVLAMTRWLHEQDFPTVRPASGIDQPMIIGDATVTFWDYIAARAERAAAGDLGTLLRRLHSLPAPPIDLPRFIDPLQSIR